MASSEASRPRVLMLCKAFPPVVGGVETYSEQVASAYAELGLRVTVITQTLGERSRETRESPHGKYDVWNVGPGSQAKAAVGFNAAAREYLHDNRPTAIHATTWRPSAPLLLQRRQSPVVTSVHGREVLNADWRLAWLQTRALNRADAIVCGSDATRQALRSAVPGLRAPERTFVDFYGLSHRDAAAAFVRSESSAPLTVFTVARHVKRKNIDGCLRAIAALDPAIRSRVNYRIAGRGPESAALEALATELGIAEHVAFLGRVSDEDLVDEYKRADIFLHPQTHVGEGNDFEGFGLVIADAMSFGCVAIAGNAGGPADYVSDGVNGFLVDGLHVPSIASRLHEVLADAALRRRVSTQGRQWALDNLSWQKHAEYVLEVASLAREA